MIKEIEKQIKLSTYKTWIALSQAQPKPLSKGQLKLRLIRQITSLNSVLNMLGFEVIINKIKNT